MIPSILRETSLEANASSKDGVRRYRTTYHEASGLDQRNIQRRSYVEDFATWRIFSAVWSVVLSHHTAQDVVEFLITNESNLRSLKESDGISSLHIHARVDTKTSFHDLVARTLEVHSKMDRPNAIHNVSSRIVIYPYDRPKEGAEGSPDLCLTTDLTIGLFSDGLGRIKAMCKSIEWLPPSYVDTIVEHFLQSLRYVIDHQNWQSLCSQDVPMMTLEEEKHIRQRSMPRRGLADMELGSVHQLFRRQALRTPTQPALQSADGEVLLYQELDLISDMIATDLRRRLMDITPTRLSTGATTENVLVVGRMLRRSFDIVTAVLSCWKAGYAIVLVDPGQPLGRNRLIIEDCACSILLIDESDNLETDNDIVWKYDFNSVSAKAKFGEIATLPPTDDAQINLSEDLSKPAWIRVTSGSTGRPKCSLHSHAAFGSSIPSYSGRLRASKTLLFLNTISSASGTPIWSFLTNGGCVCVAAQADLESDLAGCINRFNVVCLPPSALALLAPGQVPSLRSLSLVGEATPRSLAERWGQRVSILVGYGATEMNSHALPFHNERYVYFPY